MSAQVETSVLRLTLPARPEYLMFTRLVLTGLSQSVDIDRETLADLKLAVSEACSYSIRTGAPAEGRLAIAYELAQNFMAVSVEVERGEGKPEPAPAEDDGDDLGLVVIEAIVDSLEIERGAEGIERISFRKRLEP
jgi:serine/threonine-protein kinase RsbW